MKNEERGQPPYQPAHDNQGFCSRATAWGYSPHARWRRVSACWQRGMSRISAPSQSYCPVRLSILVMPFQNSIFSQAPRRAAGEPQSLLFQVSKSNRPIPHSFTDNQSALSAQVPSCLFSPATLQDNPRRRNSWAYWMLFHTCSCSWLRVHSSTNYY